MKRFSSLDWQQELTTTSLYLSGLCILISTVAIYIVYQMMCNNYDYGLDYKWLIIVYLAAAICPLFSFLFMLLAAWFCLESKAKS